MKISLQDGKSCEKVLKVTVPQELVKKEFSHFYEHVAPKAKIPGFRPGKAPRNVVELHFKKDAREAVLKNLLSDTYRQAVQEKTLQPVSYPEFEQVELTEDTLSYTARVEVRPKIKLSKIFGLKVKKEEPVVSQKEVDEGLNRLREAQATYKVVEDRPAAMGDSIISDYVCTMEGKELENRKDEMMELKEEEFLKGFSQQLVGMKAGEEREITVTFPEELPRKEIAGKPAQFKVTLKEIKVKVLPELDDEFAKSIGEHQTIADLRKKVEDDIKHEKSHEFEAAYEKALLDELIKHNKAEMPEGFVKRRLEKMIEDACMRLRYQGATEAAINEKKDEIKKDLEPEAKRQVHLAFLLDEIAEKENVTVTDKDREDRFEALSKRVRQPVEEIKKYYAGDENARLSMDEQIRNELTIELIKKNAKPKN